MGHAIIAFNSKGEKVASLNYGAMESVASVPYIVLGAQELNGGASGKGKAIEYSAEKLINAIHKVRFVRREYFGFVPNDNEIRREKQHISNFLEKSFGVAKREGVVKIYFG